MRLKDLYDYQRHFYEQISHNKYGINFDDFLPYIVAVSGYLPNNTEALMRFGLVLNFISAILLDKPTLEKHATVYQVLACLSCNQAITNGLDTTKFRFEDCTGPQEIGIEVVEPDHLLTINQAAYVSKACREHGLTVGLLHGHFRTLTPSSIAFIIAAFEHVDVVLVGIETGKRTEAHKGKVPILTDQERAILFRALLQYPFFIDDSVPYTNEGYSGLVKLISPTHYFGQTQNPPNMKQSMAQRATEAGCNYTELTSIPGLSTSALFDKFLKQM